MVNILVPKPRLAGGCGEAAETISSSEYYQENFAAESIEFKVREFSEFYFSRAIKNSFLYAKYS